MLKNFLLLATGLLWTTLAVAQTSYFHNNDGKVAVTASQSAFIITADDASILGSVREDQVKNYESWSHKPYAVVSMNARMTTEEVVASLGFDTDDVQVSPAYALADGFLLYPTRQLAVKLGDKGDLAAMQQLLGQFEVKNIVKKFGTYRIEMAQLDQVFAAANALQESGLTTFSHPDFYAPIKRFQINDPLFGDQFQMHNTGQTIDGVSGANDADCNALEAWGITLGSASITVAVIDDGLEDHEDLVDGSGNSRYTAGFSPANNGNGDAVAGSAHGVSCAGSIAATHNNIGVRGVAPLVNLISVNIFVGGESNQDLADAFTWSKNQGADVMSNSWGYGSCTLSIAVINNAIADANSNGRGGLGSVITFASGNDYNSCVSYPGDNVDVIGVGAIANTGVRSAYSNYGPALDIVAPSNNVGGPGAGVRTTDRMGSNGYGNGNYTNTFGGTSSATPVVSGVAALLLGYNPNLTSDEVKNILYTTAIDMGGAGFDNEYGHGRVNAFAALQAAGGGGSGPTCGDGLQNGQETGIDCGGPTCPSCPPVACNGTEVNISITLDSYPEETSWTLRNDAGATVASGGTYGSSPDGSTVTETVCLADDCYTFTINDAYGDGICCAYGNGAYSVTGGGSVLASGATFTSAEATDFCVGGTPADTQAPSTPASLSVSGETDDSVQLNWSASSDNVGVIGYNLFVDGTSAGTVTGTSATITGLATCTTYAFSVSAFDAADNTSSTRSANGTTTGCGGGGGGGGPVDIDGSFFETGLDGWVDGGGDCFRYQGQYSYEGSYSIRLRDNSGTRSSMTSQAYDLSGLSNVEIAFIFYPNSMENGEDFWVQYNGGSGWQTVATYAAGAQFSNGSFYAAAVTLTSGDYNLINGGQFRLRCDASNNSDQVYIDAVTITGNVAGTAGKRTLEQLATRTMFDATPTGEYEVRVSPNPASDMVTVSADEPIREVSLMTLDGRQLLHRTFDGVTTASLRVDNLPTGMYLISILTDEEQTAERVVIRR